MPDKQKKDLVVLAADSTMAFTVYGLLQQHKRLGIRQVILTRGRDTFVRPAQDSGCLRRCDDFLRRFSKDYEHAIVMLDREGCGKEKTREDLEQDIEDRLSKNGWDDRAMAIVFEPELEIWVWSNSPQVDEVVGWKGKDISLRHWLRERGFLEPDEVKPRSPKEALQAVLIETDIGFSSSVHFNLAKSVGLSRCTDPAFLKFKNKLKEWFPESPSK